MKLNFWTAIAALAILLCYLMARQECIANRTPRAESATECIDPDGLDDPALPFSIAETVDVNAMKTRVWAFDAKATEPIDITISAAGRPVTISVRNGKLDIIGDPNDYTEAARIFFTVAVPEAVYGLVAGNNAAVCRLCESGRVCEAMGHQWKTYPDVNMDRVSPDPFRLIYDIGTVQIVSFERKCVLCAKAEVRELTEWKGRKE